MIPASASTLVTSRRFVRHVRACLAREARVRLDLMPEQLAPASRALLQASLVALAEGNGLRPAGEAPRYFAEPFRDGVLVIVSLPMEPVQ